MKTRDAALAPTEVAQEPIERRPYAPPCIEEELEFETCALAACTLASTDIPVCKFGKVTTS
jgi:hypothetical protein